MLSVCEQRLRAEEQQQLHHGAGELQPTAGGEHLEIKHDRSKMPKEQEHSGERLSRSTSKTAKDKSNSATLRASQSGPRREASQSGPRREASQSGPRREASQSGPRRDPSQSGPRREASRLGDLGNMLRCDSEKDSEKDSGYSEAGSDDQRSSVSEPHTKASSRNLNNNGVNAGGRNMPPYEDLTPIYVIKNLVVKPSGLEQLLHGPMAWSGGWHNLTNAKSPAQLLLIQQPTTPAPSSSTPTPSSSLSAPQGQIKKGGSRSNLNHSRKNSYLPILNSYPRIAPHPKKESHDGKSATWVEGVKESGSEGHSQSKRVCIEEEKREAVPTTSHKDAGVHPQSQYEGRGQHSSFPGSSHCPLSNHTSSTSQRKSHHCKQSLGSPSVSSSQTPSQPSCSDSAPSSSPSSSSRSSSTDHSPYHLAPDISSTRHRRFLNTAEILNQSGLLAITLRTKELLEQNAATEREIAQLRQHTLLLCQVAQVSHNGCSKGSDSLDKLLLAMTESGSYPNMDFSQLKALSSSNQQSKTRSEKDKEKNNNIRTSETHSSPLQVGSLHNMDGGTSPPSPLFAPSPDSEQTDQADGPLDFTSVSFSRSVPKQGCRTADMDKDLNDLPALPESSTLNSYLL